MLPNTNHDKVVRTGYQIGYSMIALGLFGMVTGLTLAFQAQNITDGARASAVELFSIALAFLGCILVYCIKCKPK